jgi:deazaflavin-dependent oxidoreductase (nitroreductase family)
MAMSNHLEGERKTNRNHWWQRMTVYVATTRFGRWLILHVIHYIDLWLEHWTHGRFSSASLVGVPLLILTTKGARSGLLRSTPLLFMKHGQEIIVIASSLGSPRHPDWYFNLRSNPEVSLRIEGKSKYYFARQANGQERQDYWEEMVNLYSGYTKYASLAADREIPVIVFIPSPDGS